LSQQPQLSIGVSLPIAVVGLDLDLLSLQVVLLSLWPLPLLLSHSTQLVIDRRFHPTFCFLVNTIYLLYYRQHLLVRLACLLILFQVELPVPNGANNIRVFHTQWSSSLIGRIRGKLFLNILEELQTATLILCITQIIHEGV